MKNLCRVTFLMLILGALPSWAAQVESKNIHGASVGMSEKSFFRIYPRAKARTYRSLGEETWITFNEPRKGKPQGMITFHFNKEKLQDWSVNDRKEVVEEYLGEFCSQGIVQGDPKTHTAIKNVLEKIPQEVFLAVTQRTRPVLFTEFYDAGTARFASHATFSLSGRSLR